MAYPRLNAQTMADAWAAGVGRAGTNWTQGIQNPRQAPNANPAQMAANWQQGVANAAPRFSAAVSAGDFVTKWQQGAVAKVASFTGSGTARKSNAAAGFAKVVPMIQSSLANLPAKGPKGTNSGRAQAFGEAMHAQKGK